MFCKNCGKELENGAAFCASCGGSVNAAAGRKHKWLYVSAMVLLAVACVVFWGRSRMVIVERGAAGDSSRVIVVENGSSKPDGEAAERDRIDAAEAVKIIGDLRNLKSANLLFMADHSDYDKDKVWPKPGDEKLLNAYLDRPIVDSDPQRYQRIAISDVVKDASGAERQYIGVTLFPDRNGAPGVKKQLVERAKRSGLLNALPRDGETPAWYRDSDTVWFNLR